jgi:hypothetical protein
MGKLRKIVFYSVIVFTPIFCPPLNFADIISPAQVDIYAAKLGLKPDMDTFQQIKLKGLTQFAGIVLEPCKLEDLGFKEVRKGDRVEVTSLKNGEWKSKVLSTEQEKIFKLSIDWGADD